jgi:spore maturation protein CgeB
VSSPARILLVGPSFHGYTATVAGCLAQRGHLVTTHVYDQRPSLGARVRGKVVDELPEKLGFASSWTKVQERATAAAVSALRTVRPTVVLAIKADVLTAAFWSEAKGAGALTHLWLYDEVRRMRIDREVLALVDVLTSYSAQDTAELTASGVPTSHVANGFDAELRWSRKQSNDIVFIGARYPNREQLLVDLHERGIPVLGVGRDWSHHPVDRARTWDPRRPPVPASRDISRSASYGLMGGAAASINMHLNQDGFTMRTFEIPGAGGLQLIDRADVSTLYAPDSEVAVWESVDEAAELCRRALTDRRWATAMGEAGRRRTLAEHTMGHRVAEIEALWTA